MLCKQFLGHSKFNFCFLELSRISFFQIFSIYSWLNPQMQNPQIQRANRSASVQQKSIQQKWKTIQNLGRYLCHSVCAAIIKYHRLDGLNNRNVLLTFLETRNSKIKVPANSVTGEDSLPGLQMATFLLCAHMVERCPFLYGH